MEYGLAALKLFCSHLRDARHIISSSPTVMSLHGIRFQRAWLQGVLVSGHEDGRILLDDGSDVVELSPACDFQPHEWRKGMYVMVVGLCVPAPNQGALPQIKVHKIVNLSPFPDREAMWHLEVIEAYKLFYLPSGG